MESQQSPRGVDLRRRALGFAAGACLVGWPLAAPATARESRWRDSRRLMGTQVDLALLGRPAAVLRTAAKAAFDRMAALQAVMSHYAPTSRVAAINLAAGLQAVPVPTELMQVLRMAQSVSARTGGAFDVTVGSVGRWHFDPQAPRMPAPASIRAQLPMVDYRQLRLDERAGTAMLARRGMRIDLGGIAKLSILEAGLATLRAHGVRDALVNGGGDVVAMAAAGSPAWRVGIRDPRQPQRLLATLDVRNGFVASSGDYERFFVRGGRRFHHVLDPRTGYPTREVRGVTLVGDTLEAVNGLGAAAMVLGAAGSRDLIERAPEVEGLRVAADGTLWVSTGLQSRLGAS